MELELSFFGIGMELIFETTGDLKERFPGLKELELTVETKSRLEGRGQGQGVTKIACN